MTREWTRDTSRDALMRKRGYRYVVTRDKQSDIYTKTASDGVDMLRRCAASAPVALWSIEGDAND